MIASLPMYDLDVVRAATDRWWQGLAAHLRAAGLQAVPDRLRRDPVPGWTDTRLLFSQTCGYPLTHALGGRIEPLLTPVYQAPGCNGAHYASALVVGADHPATDLANLRGGVCAFNARDSHSGCNVLRRMIAPLAEGRTFFTRVIETGGHEAAIAAVGAGRADVCAVDAVTHALLAEHAPSRLAGTRVLTHSPRAPGLPWIAGPAVAAAERERMRTALQAALADAALADARSALLLAGAERLELADYAPIPAMEREAIALGYPQLA